MASFRLLHRPAKSTGSRLMNFLIFNIIIQDNSFQSTVSNNVDMVTVVGQKLASFLYEKALFFL